MLLRHLNRHAPLFDGTIGHWKSIESTLKLEHPQEPPFQRKVPCVQEQTRWHAVDWLCRIGVLRKVHRSEWAALAFIQTKKDDKVRFLSDARELKKRIKRKAFPTSNIQDLLLNLKGFSVCNFSSSRHEIWLNCVIAAQTTTLYPCLTLG